MKLSAILFSFAACAATLGAGQAFLPTAKAGPLTLPSAAAPAYSVRLGSLRVRRTAGDLEITGRLVNTGQRTLTYTSVAAVLTRADGREVGRGTGYLTTGPVGPGQSTELRACAASVPAFAGVTLVLHERGQAVQVVDCSREPLR